MDMSHFDLLKVLGTGGEFCFNLLLLLIIEGCGISPDDTATSPPRRH